MSRFVKSQKHFFIDMNFDAPPYTVSNDHLRHISHIIIFYNNTNAFFLLIGFKKYTINESSKRFIYIYEKVIPLNNMFKWIL